MHPLLTIAKRAAYSAGEIVAQSFEQLNRINVQEKSPNDFVSNVDIASEETLIKIIRKSYPEHLIIAEESGQTGSESSEYTWILDPIDGTTNFIKGFPHFAISIGVMKNNKLEAGLVFNPINEEMFYAARGQGAALNERKIRASTVLPENAIIETGIPRSEDVRLTANASLRNVLSTFPDIRRAGSASLGLCYAACGRVDGFYEYGLSQWDIAAGALIAEEAGAIVSDVNGELTHMQTGNIIAAPPKVYKALIKQMKK